MKVILHDLDTQYHEIFSAKCDEVIHADGKYAPCQGCFGCWTKHPAECFMKDSLRQTARVIGQADEFVIITENQYGTYSPAVKNVLDRSIGISTPLATYRGKQMHHTLRYGKHNLFKVIVYGDATEQEKETFTYMAERNAINNGFEKSEAIFLKELSGSEKDGAFLQRKPSSSAYLQHFKQRLY